MIKRWVSLAILSVIGVPLVIYVVGGLLVGPYEGENGMLSFMGNIYGDALTAELSAWFLLFSPLLLIGIWVAVLRLRRYTA